MAWVSSSRGYSLVQALNILSLMELSDVVGAVLPVGRCIFLGWSMGYNLLFHLPSQG